MTIEFAVLKARSAEVSAALADARSARNLLSRRKRVEERDEQIAEGVRRRRKAITDREADAFLKLRLRVRVSDADRPRTGSRTPRRLFTRAVEQMLKGTTGLSDARGSDGRYPIHYSFTARGFGSKTGRRWRAGEAERAAQYSVREDALEDGELGWWSNIAADRNELVAHYRASEALEKHDRANANVYIVEVIALPVELSAEQRREAAMRLCHRPEMLGLAYTVGIHRPDAAGDQRNHHLHLIYSMRPCQRIAPYEWEFGTAKLTEINTPAGIRQRRCAVVVAINETLQAAGSAKRYTPLSHRERGMAPPTRGKVGQQETAMARRLAALEHRQARLAALQVHTQWLRQTLLDAAERLEHARKMVVRRLATSSLVLSNDEAMRVTPAECRGRIMAALERASDIADHATASADNRMIAAYQVIKGRLRAAATPVQPNVNRLALSDHRAAVIRGLEAAGNSARDLSERVKSDIQQARVKLAERDLGREAESGHDGAASAAEREHPTALRDAAIAKAELEAAERARVHAHLSLKKALIMLKRKRGIIKKGENGLFIAEIADLPILERRELGRRMFEPAVQASLAKIFANRAASPSISTGKTTPANAAPADHDRSLGMGQQHDRRGGSASAGLPHGRVVGAVAEPPGVRIARGIGLDRQSEDSERVAHGMRRVDVLRRPEGHIEERGIAADRVDGPAAGPKASASKKEVDRSDRASGQTLRDQAREVFEVGEKQRVLPKGRTGGGSNPLQSHRRGSQER